MDKIYADSNNCYNFQFIQYHKERKTPNGVVLYNQYFPAETLQNSNKYWGCFLYVVAYYLYSSYFFFFYGHF